MTPIGGWHYLLHTLAASITVGDPQKTVGDSAGNRTVFELDSAAGASIIICSNLKWNMNQGGKQET